MGDFKNRKSVLAGIIVVVIVLIISIIFSGSKTEYRGKEFAISSGERGSAYHKAGSALCEIIQEETEAKCVNSESEGGLKNLSNIKNKNANIGILPADVFYKNKDRLGLKQIGTLNSKALSLVYRNPTGELADIRDLAGRKVILGDIGSDTYDAAVTILEGFGIEDDVIKYSVSGFDLEERFGLVCAGEVDAIFYLEEYPYDNFYQLLSSCPSSLSLYSLSDDLIDGIISNRPYYIKMEGSFDNYEQDFSTIGIENLIVAGNDIDEKYVRDLNSLIGKNVKIIKDKDEAFENLTSADIKKTLNFEDEKG